MAARLGGGGDGASRQPTGSSCISAGPGPGELPGEGVLPVGNKEVGTLGEDPRRQEATDSEARRGHGPRWSLG